MELKADILVDKCFELKKENVFISPLSLFFALTMIANGADGKTKEELESFLGDDIDYLNEELQEYLEELPEVIELSSSIWTNGISVKENFKNILKEYFNSEAKTFTSNDIKVINNWVEDNTNGKIHSIIENLSDEDLFLLLNAIYFKDSWMVPFKKDLTEKESFNNLDDSISKVFMMHSQEQVYFENDTAIAFAKQYESRISFIGILPKKEGDFNLEDLNIEELLNNRDFCKVNVGLPKMGFYNSISFIEILKSLGIKEAFGSNANFSNLTDSFVSIDKVIQKTSLTVDEEGSEAAGVTCIGMRKGCIQHVKPKNIILDRPFAFMIYDNCYELPLFIGKIVNL